MEAKSILRLSKIFLWSALIWLPWIAFSAAQVRFGTPEVASWLPGDDLARQSYRDYLVQFGDDQVLFVSWPGCTLEDPRLPLMTGALQALASAQPQLGIVQAIDSKEMLSRWLESRPECSLSDAQQQLQGFAIGADGSCFIALHVDAELGERRATLIDTLRDTARRVIHLSSEELILAGEPFQVYVIDRASRETVERFVAPSSILAFAIAWLCLRSFRQTLLVFTLAAIGQMLGLALIATFVGEMSAVLVVLPTLIFMLTLSGAIHLTNYYRDARVAGDPQAGVQALRLGAKPCILATLTTIFGFGSLLVSRLQPVWQFGSLAALGLGLATVLLLGLFPTLISLLPHGEHGQRGQTASEPGDPFGVLWLTQVTSRYATLISVAGAALLLFSMAGLLRLKTSTEFEDMFPPSSAAIQSLHWMQTHLGPINSLEFVLAFPKVADREAFSDGSLPKSTTANEARAQDSMGDILAQAQLLAAVHADLQNSKHVSAVLSAATFLPAMETGHGTRATIRRATLRRKLTAHRADLQAQHLLAEQPHAWAWRLSARINNLSGDNYRLIQSQLAEIVEARISDTFGSTPPSQVNVGPAASSEKPKLVITGLRAVIEKAHFALLSDLGGSFAMAFLLIVPVMMLIARGVKAGLLLMLPNVLPVAMVFGCMGWMSIKLDVASILTASVALGIAVDDTLHFVSWFLRNRAIGLNASAAVQRAIAGCARAMLHTSIICTGSMLPFFFSDFIPTSKFALLMILILGGAIVGDLLLLPAMLQSRIGRSIGEAKHEAIGNLKSKI